MCVCVCVCVCGGGVQGTGPWISRALCVLQTFLTVIALGVPYWAHVDWDMGETAHFGLFVYCPGVLQATCSSIHDNLVPGRDVPRECVCVLCRTCVCMYACCTF